MYSATMVKIQVLMVSMCLCVISCFSCVQLFAIPGTVAFQAPVHGILQARILK